MESLLFVSFILLSIAVLCYLLRFQIRRWWRADVVNRNLSPHERWPEILHWQAGDKFDRTHSLKHTQYTLVAVQEDGYAIIDFIGERDWAPISVLIGHNTSLRTRRVNKDLKQSGDYMELIRQFNLAYAELEERDKKLKLVG